MPIPSQQLWLIVAGQDDRIAQSLTGALRMAGERAILVDTPDMIRLYASEEAICVVVFSHSSLSAAALAAALELRFAAHIPIVDGDDGELPSGPWTSQPIVAQSVDAALVAQLQDRRHEIVATGAAEAIERNLAAPPALPLTKSARKQRRLRYLQIAISILNLIIVIFAVGNLWFERGSFSPSNYQPPPTYPVGVSYNVHVPGTCDKTPSVFWEIYGNNTTICQQDGLVMERDDLRYSDLTKFNVREENPSQYFGQDYSVQAAMQFIRSDATTCMGLDTLEQTGNNFGSISFLVCADGHWEVYLFSPNGIPTEQLGTGKLTHPQSAYMMNVSIHAATMIMQLNGTTITTLSDSTYTTTSSVSLVLTVSNNSNSNTTLATQALFSDFSAQPGTTAN